MKQFFVLFLCICLLLPASGCLKNDREERNTDKNVIEYDEHTELEVITDSFGTVLTIQENRQELTIASVYAVSVPFLTALELTNRVVAINVKSKLWTDSNEGLKRARTVGRGTVDIEALAELAPDVLIHRSNDAATVKAVTEKLEIQVLCIKVEDFADIKNTLTLMGKYFGCEERADFVIEWLNGKFEMIDEIVAKIPEDERVNALMMGGELGRVAGGDMIQSFMIEKAGGKCVASGIENKNSWVNIGVETIFNWNPDVIFCTSSTMLSYSVESLIADPAWSAMDAITNREIYIVPATIDSWDMPGLSCVIGTMYMLYRMYPDYFTSEQLQQEIDEYYTFMFGKSFESSYLGYNLG